MAADTTSSAPPFHARPLKDVLAELKVDPARGLSADEARARLARHGPNELDHAPPTPTWKKIAAQFADLVIWILIVAALISGVMGEWADCIAILAIVILNGLLGYLQEEKAERALEALKGMSAPNAKVLRDGEVVSVPATQVTVGDVLELEAGDNVVADARLIKAYSLRGAEAPLTGESVPVDKSAEVSLKEGAGLGDRANMVYMGTTVAAGKATAVVVGTGMRTELGRIAELLQNQPPEMTPLQRRLAELGRLLVWLCLGIVAVIFVLQMLRGGELLEVFLLSVSLAVAAVPEGLPAVVTMALALGLQRMVKRNALIRKLPSVETLGSVTTICSDKTGTLTRNEMTVRAAWSGGRWYRLTGGGCEPEGDLYRIPEPEGENPLASPDNADTRVSCEKADPAGEADLPWMLRAGYWCNNARVTKKDNGEGWQVLGDPTEGAMIVLARKTGMTDADAPPEKIDELPFDSDRKAMSVIMKTPNGGTVMYTKGAPEVLLRKSTRIRRDGAEHDLTETDRAALEAVNAAMATRALRVLAVAYRENPEKEGEAWKEESLVFAGLAGMIDPPRSEVKEAVRRCRMAGIRPVMITGDHPQTALAIGRELGMAGPDCKVLSGAELDKLSEAELEDRAAQVAVYARVSAEHKMRVVSALKKRGEVVAMTGDGVNDAPAVKNADIGIAMGITGTDVTKEAGDMVLTDDNFASIVNAVEEGRAIFDNIRKFVHYLLSCNVGEVLLVLVAVLLGWPAPLVPVQILWMNLVTDGLPALALGMEPPEPDIMQRPPRPPREHVITRARAIRMLVFGVLIAGAGLAAFWYARTYAHLEAEEDHLVLAQTMAFGTMAVAQLFFAFSCRSERYTMPRLGLLTNQALLVAIALSGLLQAAVIGLPFLRETFNISPHLSVEHVEVMVVLALLPVTIIEVGKIVKGLFVKGEVPAASAEANANARV